MNLTLNPALNFAYLVPRKNECCLDFGYQGMIQALLDDGSVQAIDAGVIFEGEKYEYRKGTDAYFSHSPDIMAEDFSESRAIAAYAVAKVNGETVFAVLPKSQVMKHKNVGAGSNSAYSPWQGEFWQAMYKKTAIRELFRFFQRRKSQLI